VPMDRYHLRAPNFCREGVVEQFIAEFSNVAAICRWPTRVILIQLQLCLTGMAKPDSVGPNFNSIFETLRAQFVLTARDSHVKLQGLRRGPETLLREHATVTELLAPFR